MANILVGNNFYHGTSDACIDDLTPPTFAGINFLDVQSRGQIRAGWAVATDTTPPIRYEVYIKASTATGLFSVVNIVGITPNLQYDIFTMPDGSFLQNGTTYYVGVRALDGVSNRDSNLVSMNVISTGVLTSIDTYKNEGVFSVDSSNNFRGTFWGTKNGSLAIAPDAVLGTGSYQVYDKDGVAVVGMSGTGITADAQGAYQIPAVPNLIGESQRHATVKLTISIDSENRVNLAPISDEKEVYAIDGISSLSSTNDLIGSFWVTKDESVVTTGLGTGSYQAFAADGTMLVGLSESGITADVNGVFGITPFALPPSVDTSLAYSVLVTITVNGTVRSHFVTIDENPTAYTCRAAFSINASNQLEATFWATINDEAVDPLILGTASYQVYDKTGAAVVGLSQTGITADVSGLFHIAAVSAALITDLTHYVTKITIEVAGQDRTVFKGFTLLGN